MGLWTEDDGVLVPVPIGPATLLHALVTAGVVDTIESTCLASTARLRGD